MIDAVKQRLIYLAADARAEVGFYSHLYRALPRIRSFATFEKLPIIPASAYSRGDLIDKLSTKSQACITRTTYDDRVSGSYPRLLSYEDLLREYDLLAWLVRFLGESRRKNNLLLVSSQRFAYCLAELGKMLAFHNWRVLALTSAASCGNQTLINQFAPTLILTDPSSHFVPPTTVRHLVRLEENTNLVEHPRSSDCGLLFNRLTGIIAIRRTQDDVYTYSRDHFYLEVSGSGRLTVTSFLHRFQPLIRIELPISGEIIDHRRFRISS